MLSNSLITSMSTSKRNVKMPDAEWAKLKPSCNLILVMIDRILATEFKLSARPGEPWIVQIHLLWCK